jgi:hypothetical protein
MLEFEGLCPFAPSRPRFFSGRIEGLRAFIDSLFTTQEAATRGERIGMLEFEGLCPFAPSRPRFFSGRIEGLRAFIDSLFTLPLDTAPEATEPTRGERIFGSCSEDREPFSPSSRLLSAAYRGPHLFVDTPTKEDANMTRATTLAAKLLCTALTLLTLTWPQSTAAQPPPAAAESGSLAEWQARIAAAPPLHWRPPPAAPRRTRPTGAALRRLV